MKPLLEGQDLRPDNLKSDWFDREEKMGSWQCSWKLFLVLAGSEGPLVIIIARCYCLCMQWIFIVLHVPLTVEWESVIGCLRLPEKRQHFHLYSWQGLDPDDFIGCRVVLLDKTRFIASLCLSLYVETLQCGLTAKYFSTHNGPQIKENLSIDLHKLPSVREGFVPQCACCVLVYLKCTVSVWDYWLLLFADYTSCCPASVWIHLPYPLWLYIFKQLPKI